MTASDPLSPSSGATRTSPVMVKYQRVPDFGSLRNAMHQVDYVAIIDGGSRAEITEEFRSLVQNHAHKHFLFENAPNLRFHEPTTRRCQFA